MLHKTLRRSESSLSIASLDEGAILLRYRKIDRVRAEAIRESLSAMVTGIPDLVLIHGGGTVQLQTNEGSFTMTPGFSHSDGVDNAGRARAELSKPLASGAAYRVFAGAILAHAFPNTVLEVNSRYIEPGKAASYDVMSDELAELGISPNRIHKEQTSMSTIGNVIELVRLLGRNPDWKNVVLLSNLYHCDRIRVILQAYDLKAIPEERDEDYLRGKQRIDSGDVSLSVVAGEDILTMYDPAFAQDFALIQGTVEYQDRLVSDAHGTEQLRAEYDRSIGQAPTQDLPPYQRNPSELNVIRQEFQGK